MTQARTQLARLLFEHRIEQVELAKRLGVSKQSVGAWVNGTEACPESRQARIVIILRKATDRSELTLADFFDPDTGKAI